MAKKRKQAATPKKQVDGGNVTVSDALDEDVLAKLKAAKQELSAAESAKEEERQAQLLRERKEREKNKSFAELLDEYGDLGSKF
ncbi:YqkE family protein [Sporosarcina sp. 179-K 3D1 HS]|uniref:YqkE family protein n=1 Tax=Sporosarcina sp. 179-K 3D1 HS TaxID=3232169 RepID=UPI00399F6CFD